MYKKLFLRQKIIFMLDSTLKLADPEDVPGALKSAGAEIIRSVALPSGIVLSEWSCHNTLTDYKSASENVLSIYLSGGENCSQMRQQQIVRSGFENATCLFPKGGGESRWRITGRLNFLHIYFDPEKFGPAMQQSLRQPPEACQFREVFQEASPVIGSAARSIALTDWNDTGLSTGIEGLTSWIILHAIRDYAVPGLEKTETRGRFSARHARLLRDYLDAHLGASVQLDDLAGLVNLSRYHFLRKFKSTFGQSPHAFLTELRMARAHDMLQHTTQKIAAVAFECGYSQQSHFTSAFRRCYGYPPSAVRRR